MKDNTYDAFGNQLSTTNSHLPYNMDTNAFRYCGEYWNEDTGYIYLRARDYDPSTGRFITQDPAKDGLNWYVYCGNNPVNFVDPLGEDAILITDKEAVGGLGHTSALFQDSKGHWYYFYWGLEKSIVEEVPDDATNSLADLNYWLYNNTDWTGGKIYSGYYTEATYVAGDFTASLKKAIQLAQNFDSRQYSANSSNCLTMTWNCFREGRFYDETGGISVKFFTDEDIGIIPNRATKYFRSTFYNNEFEHYKYWKKINDQLWDARQQLKKPMTSNSNEYWRYTTKMLEYLYH